MSYNSLMESLLNQPFSAPDGRVEGLCWEFCKRMNPALPAQPYLGMRKIEQPRIGCVVLFKIGKEWHIGIVWPDGLHFVHVKPEKNGIQMVRQNRLTEWPWTKCLEGFYEPC